MKKDNAEEAGRMFVKDKIAILNEYERDSASGKNGERVFVRARGLKTYTDRMRARGREISKTYCRQELFRMTQLLTFYEDTLLLPCSVSHSEGPGLQLVSSPQSQ